MSGGGAPLVFAWLTVAACTEAPFALEAPPAPVAEVPFDPEPIEIRLTAAWSATPQPELQVAFVSPSGVLWATTDDEGRARSGAAATDVHVFDGPRIISALGAPAALEIVLPRNERPAVGRELAGRVQGLAEPEDRQVRLLALTGDVRLEGWALGSGDRATGLPTHLPRWSGGSSEVEGKVVFGGRATALAALVFSSGLVPTTYGLQSLTSGPEAGTWLVAPGPLPEARGERPFDEVENGDELRVATVSVLEGGARLSLPAQSEGGSAVGPCGLGPCALRWQRAQRADLGDQLGVAVATWTAFSGAQVTALPPPATRSGRTAEVPDRPDGTQTQVIFRPEGAEWQIWIYDDREHVEAPALRSGPHPIDAAGPNERIAERTDVRWTGTPRTTEDWYWRAESWARRRWLPR